MKKTVLYIGNFLFPEEGAAAKRVLNIGRALRLSDYEVIYAGNNVNNRKEDKDIDNIYRYDGFEYYKNDIVGILNKRIDYYYSFKRIKKIICDIENKNKRVEVIIGYHMDFLGMIQCINYCKKNKIKFISDCTEWYDPRQVVHGLFGLSYYNSQLRMLIANKKVDGLIAISSYLEDYYKKYTNVLRVPALDNVNTKVVNIEEENEEVRFVYCGNPGKKDDLLSIWNAFEKIGNSYKWKLNIVGIDKSHFLFNEDKYSKEVINRFKFYGRLSLKEAQNVIEESDFSILIRPEDRRYTKAGFPTKFSESLALGVPMICNLTSDIKDYLINLENGITVNGSSELDLVQALNSALNLERDKIEIMKINARKTAEIYFDYRNYKERLSNLIENEVL